MQHDGKLNLVQVQKWSFALEKTTDFELDLVYAHLQTAFSVMIFGHEA
jgi:hypothetical protein